VEITCVVPELGFTNKNQFDFIGLQGRVVHPEDYANPHSRALSKTKQTRVENKNAHCMFENVAGENTYKRILLPVTHARSFA